ncbi:hypothetical protein V8B97DRAFT_2078358 [Scleroderma yunnanense]
MTQMQIWPSNINDAPPHGTCEGAVNPLIVSEYISEIFFYMKEVKLPNQSVQVYYLIGWSRYMHASIINHFLSAHVILLAKLQLVGIMCLLLATKVEEIIAPSILYFLHCADLSYTKGEILLAKHYVLKIKYLLDIATLKWRLLTTLPSLITVASIWLTGLILGHEMGNLSNCNHHIWLIPLQTPNLVHYSMYAESSLISTVNLMLR